MPRYRGLSPKQQKFCQEYIKCCDATKAYLAAYDTTNTKLAGVEGSLLLKRDDITQYLAELNKPLVNQINNDREKKRKILWKRIEICIEKGDETAIARYMDILNKMDMEYVNINRNIDDSGKELAGLDIDQLKQLIGEPTEQ